MLLLSGWSIKSQGCIASPGYVFDFNLAETCRQEIPFNAGIDFSGTPKPVVAGQDFQDFRISMIITDTAAIFWKNTTDISVNRQKLAETDMGDRQGLPLNIIQRINH